MTPEAIQRIDNVMEPTRRAAYEKAKVGLETMPWVWWSLSTLSAPCHQWTGELHYNRPITRRRTINGSGRVRFQVQHLIYNYEVQKIHFNSRSWEMITLCNNPNCCNPDHLQLKKRGAKSLATRAAAGYPNLKKGRATQASADHPSLKKGHATQRKTIARETERALGISIPETLTDEWVQAMPTPRWCNINIPDFTTAGLSLIYKSAGILAWRMGGSGPELGRWPAMSCEQARAKYYSLGGKPAPAQA